MSAALGKFEFFLVVAGDVEPALPSGHQITIRKAGVFMQDDYDFVGRQFLGTWDIETHQGSRDPLAPGCWITNSDFRSWRDATGKGGDYEVYSDMKVTYFDPPLVFSC